jgi:hypothetical protein
MKNEC